MTRVGLVLVMVGALNVPASSQVVLSYGDVMVSASTAGDHGRILIYRSNGDFKGELASANWTIFRETVFRDGAVYVATIDDIWRVSHGQMSRFTDIHSPVWLAPALDGSLVVANGSGDLFHIAANGTRLVYRDPTVSRYPPAHGLELASDQCTVYYLDSAALIKWDVCSNSEPSLIGPVTNDGTRTALRLLPDGTFLAAYRRAIHRLGADGNIIGNYPIPSHGLALDVDRRSSWAGAGRTLVKVDITTGAMLLSVDVPPGLGIDYLGVVGEPRASLGAAADIPLLSPVGAGLLILALALVAYFALGRSV